MIHLCIWSCGFLLEQGRYGPREIDLSWGVESITFEMVKLDGGIIRTAAM